MIKLDAQDGGNSGSTKASQEQVVRVAIKTAVGLRRSMSSNGIRQITDFVNGMVFAGLLLQKNYDGDGDGTTFAEVFSRNASRYSRMLRDEAYASDIEELRRHQMGVTDQSKVQMLITAGLGAESTISTIARDYGFDRTQALEVAAIAVVAAVVAVGDVDDKSLEAMVESVVDKTEAWNCQIPSDDEMFGDFDA